MIYQVFIFSEQNGPGSTGSVSVHSFSTTQKRRAFVSDWINEQIQIGNNQMEGIDPLMFYGKDGWTYWLELRESELDSICYNGQLLKKY